MLLSNIYGVEQDLVIMSHFVINYVHKNQTIKILRWNDVKKWVKMVEEGESGEINP